MTEVNEEYYKKIFATVIIISLSVLSFFLLKPLLIAIIAGILLAFVFSPVYDLIYSKFKSKDLSASLISLFLILIILLPLWFLTPILIEQSFKLYLAAQQIDFIAPLKSIFPSFFASDQFSEQVGSIISSFITRMSNYLTKGLSDLILDFPTLSLKFLVTAFTFYYVLRDKEEIISYIKSLLPFSKEVEKKLFESSKIITNAVIYGFVIVGILQGFIAGVGFLIFSVPNALILMLLAMVGGMIPLLGPVVIWVPVVVYLFVAGNTFSAIGVGVFGIFASTIDNFLRPMFISRRTRLNTSLVLIGMIGGFFLFGILGFILGPLIIAYLLIILEIYRHKKSPGIIVESTPDKG
jgi:predicted PurR-regulated permease PerM